MERNDEIEFIDLYFIIFQNKCLRLERYRTEQNTLQQSGIDCIGMEKCRVVQNRIDNNRIEVDSNVFEWNRIDNNRRGQNLFIGNRFDCNVMKQITREQNRLNGSKME